MLGVIRLKLDDDIHNYYEQMVLDYIQKLELTKSQDYLADLKCLALNQLPPRYIRHEVDMAFYLPNSERQQMSMNVVNAVSSGMDFMDKHPKEE